MNKSEFIKAGLRKRFQFGESKLAKRKCYGYKTDANGELVIDPKEAEIVTRIFTQYQSGMSLGGRLPLNCSNSKFPLRPEKLNGAGKPSTSCCPMKNIRAEFCCRKRSALVVCR